MHVLCYLKRRIFSAFLKLLKRRVSPGDDGADLSRPLDQQQRAYDDWKHCGDLMAQSADISCQSYPLTTGEILCRAVAFDVRVKVHSQSELNSI